LYQIYIQIFHFVKTKIFLLCGAVLYHSTWKLPKQFLLALGCTYVDFNDVCTNVDFNVGRTNGTGAIKLAAQTLKPANGDAHYHQRTLLSVAQNSRHQFKVCKNIILVCKIKSAIIHFIMCQNNCLVCRNSVHILILWLAKMKYLVSFLFNKINFYFCLCRFQQISAINKFMMYSYKKFAVFNTNSNLGPGIHVPCYKIFEHWHSSVTHEHSNVYIWSS